MYMPKRNTEEQKIQDNCELLGCIGFLQKQQIIQSMEILGTLDLGYDVKKQNETDLLEEELIRDTLKRMERIVQKQLHTLQ